MRFNHEVLARVERVTVSSALKQVNCVVDWLTCWPTDWLADWLADLMIDWLIDWLIDSSGADFYISIQGLSATRTPLRPGRRIGRREENKRVLEEGIWRTCKESKDHRWCLKNGRSWFGSFPGKQNEWNVIYCHFKILKIKQRMGSFCGRLKKIVWIGVKS